MPVFQLAFLSEFCDQFRREWSTLVGRDEAVKALALDRVGVRDDSSFCHVGVLDEGGLDLGCAQQVARHVQHVVHAACDPQISIFVPPGT